MKRFTDMVDDLRNQLNVIIDKLDDLESVVDNNDWEGVADKLDQVVAAVEELDNLFGD